MNKRLLQSLPELYLILATIYYWGSTTLWNPIAIILFVIIGYQFLFKKTIPGVIIATIFTLLNLYMVLALVSELLEFTETNTSFWQLLIVGSLFLGLNLTAGIAMFFKYVRPPRVISQ